MDIANPNVRIFADGMFFSCSNVIGFALFYGKNHGDTDDGKQGTLEETETGTATETQQEPVIQTVKITATGDCTLGATQTHGYAGSFHEYYDKYGQDYFLKMSEVFLSRMILH